MNDRRSFIISHYLEVCMAIIVDKVQKRRDIALSCIDLLLEKGIKKLTVAEVAKTAGVSKGSIYDYFDNKEDIVYEVIRALIFEYQKEKELEFSKDISSREKVFHLFEFVLDDSEKYTKDHNLYKEYVSINLGSVCEGMCGFNNECSDFFTSIATQIIQEGVDKGELVKESLSLIKGLLALEKGFLFISWTQEKDIKNDLKEFLNTLFDLLEIKK